MNIRYFSWLMFSILALPSLVIAGGKVVHLQKDAHLQKDVRHENGVRYHKRDRNNKGVRYYLSLGTSLSVGVQPDTSGTNQLTNEGYADQLFDLIEPQYRKIRLVKLGCPTERTTTLISGGICSYEEGSQLAEAVQFLHAHKNKVELVTIDIGVNDILQAGCNVLSVDYAMCLQQAFNDVAVNLNVILTTLRDAAHPDTRIVGMNYYNTFLVSWLAGPQGQALARQSSQLAEGFNIILDDVYGAYGVPVADVFGEFNSTIFSDMVNGLPLNVASICQWTFMCSDQNIHANSIGYGVMASAFAKQLLVGTSTEESTF